VISASAEVNKEIFTVHDQPPSDARWAVILFSDFDDAGTTGKIGKRVRVASGNYSFLQIPSQELL